MSLPQVLPFLMVQEYLDTEREAPYRREFVAGRVYLMPEGSSDRHNRIAGNLLFKLDAAIDPKKLEVFAFQVKLRVNVDTFYYPDVMVTCDDPIVDDYFREKPILVIEVLSPSTQRTDQTEKLAAYRSIPPLREYAIVWQDAPRVFVYRKTDSEWQSLMIADSDQTVVFESVGVTMTLDEIYRNVRW